MLLVCLLEDVTLSMYRGKCKLKTQLKSLESFVKTIAEIERESGIICVGGVVRGGKW